MPAWLTEQTGAAARTQSALAAGVAFFQGLIDTKNAATVVPGEFFSTGHDYRADLAAFVRVAFGFSDVDDGQMERIEAGSELQR